MNYCNCPNCRTDNCPNAESYATKAEHENDTFVIGDIIRLRRELNEMTLERDAYKAANGEHMAEIVTLLAQREEIEELRAALVTLLKSRGCFHNGEPEMPEEISAQFDINIPEAREIIAALTKPQPSQT